jgi:hypothetical protein
MYSWNQAKTPHRRGPVDRYIKFFLRGYIVQNSRRPFSLVLSEIHQITFIPDRLLLFRSISPVKQIVWPMKAHGSSVILVLL